MKPIILMKKYSFLLILIFPFQQIFAQDLLIINEAKMQKKLVHVDSNHIMMELRTMIPTLVYDLKYGTKENFTKEVLYNQKTKTFLRLPIARALEQVQADLTKKGLGLKIWDAYRPYSVTKKMWDLIKDERYVANPSKGSGHNRGLSVDLTIIDLQTGKELNMGTDFDHFTDTAHHNFKNLSPVVLQNRKLLKETMEKHGFNALDTEWWHYSWPNTRCYEVMDLDFNKLQKMQKLKSSL
jgi:zinc D-Ala-D-Ala dipeptidase